METSRHFMGIDQIDCAECGELWPCQGLLDDQAKLANRFLPLDHESPHMTVVSGEKRANETRVTSSTGGQKGAKPQRMDLLPPDALMAVSEVYGFGAAKYADHNYRKGYAWSLSYAALQRHLSAFWDGEDNDPESGLPHMGHAAFHALTLITFMAEHPEFDDRYRKAAQ